MKLILTISNEQKIVNTIGKHRRNLNIFPHTEKQNKTLTVYFYLLLYTLKTLFKQTIGLWIKNYN